MAELPSQGNLIVSVQASDGSPVDDPETLLKLAKASQLQGVSTLRLQGVHNIRAIRQGTGARVIGLIKRTYANSEVYITPSAAEVDALLRTGCEVIALDGTRRKRPHSATLCELVRMIHEAGRLAMADCDCLASALYAQDCDVDIIGTTLAGYTDERPLTPGPDLELVRELATTLKTPIIAEGRYSEAWQVRAALAIGAESVVIGGAINDPVKQTKAMLSGVPKRQNVAAFDIGGTWLRFAVCRDGKLGDVERIPLPRGREERLAWMSRKSADACLETAGISTGGTVDPTTNTVWEAKPIIPDHVGSDFNRVAGNVYALNDGLATAWAHSWLPEFAGRRVATLALGTGVGCGFVANGKLSLGRRGEYLRLNDLQLGESSFEDLLGGAALSPEPDREARQRAQRAFDSALEVIRAMLLPDDIVVCGGVGLAPWLQLPEGVQRSPFGEDAGLYGAVAVAQFKGLLSLVPGTRLGRKRS